MYHFRDKAKEWSKIEIFKYLPAFDVPVRGSTSDYCRKVWYEK